MTVTTVPTNHYHSAHKPTAQAPSIARWSDGHSIALTYDVMAGPLPPAYEDCDVLYADLPWANGFDTFNQRANAPTGRTHKGFLASVAAIIEATKRPTYLVTGRHALRGLPAPTEVAPTRLNEHAAIIITYNAPPLPRAFATHAELLRHLSQQHDRVGDFCCGYGAAARVFARAGKEFTASDYNPQCIGYISQRANAWRPL